MTIDREEYRDLIQDPTPARLAKYARARLAEMQETMGSLEEAIAQLEDASTPNGQAHASWAVGSMALLLSVRARDLDDRAEACERKLLGRKLYSKGTD